LKERVQQGRRDSQNLSKLDLKRLGAATTLYEPPPFPFCHPERTRISCLTALTAATYVVLSKENHMQSIEAATLDRKFGEGEGSAVLRTFRGNAEFDAQTELSSRASSSGP
jgi:hypothetical protein